MQFNRRLAIAAAFGLFWFSTPISAQDLPPPLPLASTLEVAKAEWHLGEPVVLIQTRCNESDTELVFEDPIQCPIEAVGINIWDADFHLVAFRSVPGPPPFCAPETWQPGECRTSSLAWPQTSGDFFDSAQGSQVAPGIYFASDPDGNPGLPVEFSILPTPRAVPALTSWTLALLASLIAVIAGARLAKAQS